MACTNHWDRHLFGQCLSIKRWNRQRAHPPSGNPASCQRKCAKGHSGPPLISKGHSGPPLICRNRPCFWDLIWFCEMIIPNAIVLKKFLKHFPWLRNISKTAAPYIPQTTGWEDSSLFWMFLPYFHISLSCRCTNVLELEVICPSFSRETYGGNLWGKPSGRVWTTPGDMEIR